MVVPQDQTVCVLCDNLPVELGQTFIRQIIQGPDDITGDTSNIWKISNKYYNTEVALRLWTEAEAAHTQASDVPAVIVVVDERNQVSQAQILGRISEWPNLEICLVVGTGPTEGSLTEAQLEAWVNACLEHGFEYVSLAPLESNSEPTGSSASDLEGSTGISRIREALQAHPWPSSILKGHKPTPKPPTEPAAVTSFEDDFAPFVSAPTSTDSDSRPPTDQEIESIRRLLFDVPPPHSEGALAPDEFPDDDDTAFDLTRTLNRLQALKVRADGMTEVDRRRFAETVALGFAAHFPDD